MASTRTIFQLAPELLNLTDIDLTVLDLALATVLDNWQHNSEKTLMLRGPLVSSQQYTAAKELHAQVLKIKLEAVPS